MVASKVRLYNNSHTSYYFFVFVFYNRSVAFPRCKVTVEVKNLSNALRFLYSVLIHRF